MSANMGKLWLWGEFKLWNCIRWHLWLFSWVAHLEIEIYAPKTVKRALNQCGFYRLIPITIKNSIHCGSGISRVYLGLSANATPTPGKLIVVFKEIGMNALLQRFWIGTGIAFNGLTE